MNIILIIVFIILAYLLCIHNKELFTQTCIIKTGNCTSTLCGDGCNITLIDKLNPSTGCKCVQKS